MDHPHIRVLMIEDQATDAELLVAQLQAAGFDPDWHTDEAAVVSGILGHGTPFLEKPFQPRALAAKVREVLGSVESGL